MKFSGIAVLGTLFCITVFSGNINMVLWYFYFDTSNGKMWILKSVLYTKYSKPCVFFVLFFFKQKTAYEIASCLVGSEMCIRDRFNNVDFWFIIFLHNGFWVEDNNHPKRCLTVHCSLGCAVFKFFKYTSWSWWLKELYHKV